MKKKISKEKKKQKTTKNMNLIINNKGITLIALVITIIVLLILAGVTINLTLGENGIFKTAEQAGRNYTQAQEKELAALANFENEINNVIGASNSGDGSTDMPIQLVEEIILNKTEVTLGVNKTEILTVEINPDNATNKNITWTSTNVEVATVENGEITTLNEGETTIKAEAQDGSGVSATCKVTVKKQLSDIAKPGDYVRYDTGTEKGVLTFRILYNDATYGLQIISDENVEEVKLGARNDEYSAINSYNNAIATLNQKAERYATSSPYAIDGRCVGSVPTVGADGKFNAKNTENIGPVELQFSTSIKEAYNMKGQDDNYNTDYYTMEETDISKSGEYYWLASRYVENGEWACDFYMYGVDSMGGLGFETIYVVNADGFSHSGLLYTHGLRPVISLDSNVEVIGGDGSEETPYELGYSNI